ncbi:hypothetical protein GCM10023192_34630 [Amycolatopsis samaneae]
MLWLLTSTGVVLVVVICAVSTLAVQIARGRGGRQYLQFEQTKPQNRLDEEQLGDVNVRRLALDPEATIVLHRAALVRLRPPYRRSPSPDPGDHSNPQ